MKILYIIYFILLNLFVISQWTKVIKIPKKIAYSFLTVSGVIFILHFLKIVSPTLNNPSFLMGTFQSLVFVPGIYFFGKISRSKINESEMPEKAKKFFQTFFYIFFNILVVIFGFIFQVLMVLNL